MGRLIELIPLPYPDAVVAVGAAALGVSSGVLGAFAVLRQRSLVADALAHAALPGVCVAFIATGAKDVATLLAGAALAGVVAAFLMVGIERGTRLRPDAVIGVVLSSFFSLGIVLLTWIGHSDDADQAGLERYLFGQAAGLLERDVEVMAVLALASVALVAAAFRPLKATLFDHSFAASQGLPVRAFELAATAALVVAVVVGIRTVGAILMVAMIVAPTAIARQFTNRLSRLLPLAAVVGVAVGVSGSLLSARAVLPTGPVIVLVAVAVVVGSVLFAPGRGVVAQARRLARDRERALVEGVLVDLEDALHAGPPPTADELRLASGRSRRALGQALRALDRAGFVARDGERLRLTETGAAAAHALLDRRRLWTAWLEHGWRVETPDAREADPRDLRGSLGDDVVDRLEALAAEAG